MNCPKCGLPKFFGIGGYAGPQCLCDVTVGPIVTVGEVPESFKLNDPLYKDGFKAGAASERIIALQDDDSLRFIKRVLEGDAFTAQDKVECLRLIHAIRTRIRGGYTDEI